MVKYDFSEGKRGKFYKKEVIFNLPIYLEPEILSFVERIAKKKKVDLSVIVNQLIKTDMRLIDLID